MLSKYHSANLWFERAMTYRDRGQRAKAIHALKIGRQCAIEVNDRELEFAFYNAMVMVAV